MALFCSGKFSLTVSKLQYGRMLSPHFVSPLQSSSCRRYSLELTKQWFRKAYWKSQVLSGVMTHTKAPDVIFLMAERENL